MDQRIDIACFFDVFFHQFGYTHILNAANAVIRNNHGRKEKTLWTENEDGNMIQFRQFDSAYEEAEYVVGDIRRHVNKELCSYKDNAVLYRTNAQSRMFEERFVRDSIPYKVIGVRHRNCILWMMHIPAHG